MSSLTICVAESLTLSLFAEQWIAVNDKTTHLVSKRGHGFRKVNKYKLILILGLGEISQTYLIN